MERQLQEAQNERSTLESELKSVRQEAQNTCSFLELQLNSAMKKNFRLDAKIGGLKDTLVTLASETKDSIKELTEVSKENSANIQGLQKLQILIKQRGSISSSSNSNSHSASYSSECVSTIKATEGRQGQQLFSLKCMSKPRGLAVLDSSATSHTVALTLPDCHGIDITICTVLDFWLLRTFYVICERAMNRLGFSN
ncbi:hypothetical protein PoB_003627200 [Plakobranchus ocellatus]|uniref:Golgin-84 n=1 Tax=Plakobranchus ocellatus TaxID=259542 RepID=A0AAV4AS50_9GAST|nr:hypothetical protein PoB_003627200 [Plakobranchus ocellatus]